MIVILASIGRRVVVSCEQLLMFGNPIPEGLGMKTTLLFLLAVSMVWAGGLTPSRIQGEYVEARTADVFTGPCFANSEVQLTGDLAVFGWKIGKGSWQGVNLDGLGVVGVVRASATLGDVHHSAYPVKSVIIIDDRANAEQRIALKQFAQRMSNDLLSDVVRVEYQPIELTFENGDLHSAKAILTAGNLAKIATRPIRNGDHLCSNEEVWYAPLTKVDHAMPAYALDHSFRGKGLDTVWSSPEKRSAFVASFHFQD